MNRGILTNATAIEYEALIWRDGDSVVAHAWPLDVVSAGDDEDHALRMLDEAVSLFLEGAEEIGTLHDILIETGYTLQGNTLVPPKVRHARAVTRLTSGADASSH